MLSILIPVYNYNISNLVAKIHKQAIEAKVGFEILCLEDYSTNFLAENKSTVESLENASIIMAKANNGRTKSRQILCDKAKFNWLLFLDADVIPKRNTLIKTYINSINSSYEAIYGGVAYLEQAPKKDTVLRWKYGRKYEEVDAKLRNKTPYQITTSGNFLIKKKVFNLINNAIKIRGYGLDNYFASLLLHNNIKVLHLNNEVYHLGIEKNIHYLDKVEEAIKTLIWLFNEEKMSIHSNKLLSIYVVFKKFRLNYLMHFLFPIFSPLLKKNLVGNNPNMFLLQLYKVLYICFEDLNNN